MNSDTVAGVLGVVALVGIPIAVVVGIGETYAVVDDCHLVSRTYVEADYAEYNCIPGMDFDGNPTVDCGWDYWSKSASPVWTVETINGKLVGTNPRNTLEKAYVSGGYYILPYPPHDKSMESDFDFDDFSFYRKNEFKIRLTHTEVEKATVSESENKYNACLQWRSARTHLTVRTFFGNVVGIKT